MSAIILVPGPKMLLSFSITQATQILSGQGLSTTSRDTIKLVNIYNAVYFMKEYKPDELRRSIRALHEPMDPWRAVFFVSGWLKGTNHGTTTGCQKWHRFRRPCLKSSSFISG